MADQDSSKKIRKGTRSCQECRRRKKHCIWPPDSNSCSECIARGTPCLKQQVSQSKRAQQTTARNLQDRVAQLENVLQTLGPAGANTRSASPSDDNNSSPPSLTRDSSRTTPIEPSTYEDSAGHRLDNAPVASLFKNSILGGKDDKAPAEVEGNDQGSDKSRARARVLQEKRRRLLSVFPPSELENIILNADHWSWKMWAQTFNYLFGISSTYDINQLVADCKNGPTVPHVAKALLCVTLSLQEAPDGVTQRYGLPAQARQDMINRQRVAVAETLFADEELCTTLEGLECFVLQIKFDINLGRLRKGWIDSRRAIAYAQLLGYQRIPEPTTHDIIAHRKRGLWRNLYTVDRWSSLLTGLPTGIAESAGTAWNENTIPPDHRYFQTLTNIIGHIVDRNQEPPSHRTLSKTIQIEGELADVAATMPEEWWEIPKNAPVDAELMSQRIIPQFWHYQARLLLHLPYMLKANTDRRYEYHRIATLESARSMIHVFRKLRPAHGFGSHLCKVIDFQVFTAAMVLILQHFGNQQSGASSPSSSQTGKDGETDQELILSTTEVMQQANSEIDEAVVKEATKALELFNKAWNNAAELAQQGLNKVFVPYYGPVVFGDFAKARPSSTESPNKKSKQQQGVAKGLESVTQSLAANKPFSSRDTTTPPRNPIGLPTPSYTASDAASTTSSSRQQHSTPGWQQQECQELDFSVAVGRNPDHPASTSLPHRTNSSSSAFPTPTSSTLHSPHPQPPFSISDQPLTAYNPSLHSQQEEIWKSSPSGFTPAPPQFPRSSTTSSVPTFPTPQPQPQVQDSMDFAWGNPFASSTLAGAQTKDGLSGGGNGSGGGGMGMDLDFSGDDWSWFWDNTQIGGGNFGEL